MTRARGLALQNALARYLAYLEATLVLREADAQDPVEAKS
jgi:hypothetical protein